jgi:hypothetical protein
VSAIEGAGDRESPVPDFIASSGGGIERLNPDWEERELPVAEKDVKHEPDVRLIAVPSEGSDESTLALLDCLMIQCSLTCCSIVFVRGAEAELG